MKNILLLLLALAAAGPAASQQSAPKMSGNPLFPGWYADPEAIIFGDTYWIFPTYSDHFGAADSSSGFTDWQKERRAVAPYAPFLIQTFFNAFSSNDLTNWTKHSHVLDIKDVSWAAYAFWAPSIIEKQGRYFLFFGANDIRNNQEKGGIGIAVADNPAGPYKDYLGKPLVGEIVHGAQPIDQFVFHDSDGKYYLIYGGIIDKMETGRSVSWAEKCILEKIYRVKKPKTWGYMICSSLNPKVMTKPSMPFTNGISKRINQPVQLAGLQKPAVLKS